MATTVNPGSEQLPKPETTIVHTETEQALTPKVIYRCKKCRRIVASDEIIVPHKRGKGDECFKWKKRSGNPQPTECSSIFIEPMKWMQTIQDGLVENKLQCTCNARLGSFNWAGMQCNCGTWVNPAFQLHKSRLDVCHL